MRIKAFRPFGKVAARSFVGLRARFPGGRSRRGSHFLRACGNGGAFPPLPQSPPASASSRLPSRVGRLSPCRTKSIVRKASATKTVA